MKKKRILSGVEKFLYKVYIVLIVGLIVCIVYSETTIARVNVEIQKLEKEVELQKKKNESLEMKIDEMTSLENIKEVSEQFGLTYNSDNIKTVK